MILSCDSFCHFFRNAQKSKNFIFGSFPVLKLITCIFFEIQNPFQNPISESDRKNGAFRKKWKPYMVRKLGISRKMHVINFKAEKEPQIIVFDFGYFKRMHMPSRRKCIFHILFGAFHNTGGILDKLKKFLEDVKYTCRHMHEILNKLKIRTI